MGEYFVTSRGENHTGPMEMLEQQLRSFQRSHQVAPLLWLAAAELRRRPSLADRFQYFACGGPHCDTNLEGHGSPLAPVKTQPLAAPSHRMLAMTNAWLFVNLGSTTQASRGNKQAWAIEKLHSYSEAYFICFSLDFWPRFEG